MRKFAARARMPNRSAARYTASAPKATAARSCSIPPAGASSSIGMLPNDYPSNVTRAPWGVSSITRPEIGQAVADAVGHGPVLLFAGRRAGLEQARHGDLRIIAVITGQVGRERHHFHRVGLPRLGGRHINAEHVHELHDGVARLAHGGGFFGREGLRIGHERIRIAHE